MQHRQKANRIKECRRPYWRLQQQQQEQQQLLLLETQSGGPHKRLNLKHKYEPSWGQPGVWRL